MIPLHDENPTRTFPLFTIGLVAANILVFFWELSLAQQGTEFITEYGLVPYQLTHQPLQNYPNVFSSMFMHAGWGHLLGNMLYLWIFGNNIEDQLGKLRFILFYLTCGALAAGSHVAADLNSQIPMVGASGAISGVLGAYLMLFPFARVKTLVFLGFFITIVRIPAIFLLLVWVGLQVLNNMATGPDSGGVAWLAHIGGFIVGAVLIHPFRLSARTG
ncbi:rhomboid family intramembrane serine protease [Nitrospina watsonii]|uniref:Peptidase, S54 (Rhomboid) family n=1 Tax=Nitrospina watsonii TaxID=1323948 RepID=A0ABN8VXS4_9BACT|nr:rhomboid family intramembrane serine protease [Nitrospina watsonii]CAI2717996.1 Putative peptidase, S54 (Rhomboid) family [Nitrospina watsonii]